MSVYAINKVDVVHEVIEGEAILINMKTGIYYSLDGVGGLVWECLQNGPASAASIVATLQGFYSVSADEMEKEISRLLAEMQADNLIGFVEEKPQAAPLAAPAEKKPFLAPQLMKYTDLEALLLLDPIHDVSAEGWPNPKPDDETN